MTTMPCCILSVAYGAISLLSYTLCTLLLLLLCCSLVPYYFILFSALVRMQLLVLSHLFVLPSHNCPALALWLALW